MKKKAYLDTTIASYFFDNRDETAFLTKTTRNWFAEQAADYDIFISDETLVEADAGDYPNKDKVVEFIAQWPMLPHAPILNEIVSAYIQNRLMPQEYGGDALHLAYASYYKIDFLLTWNCHHLANANKKEHIRVINSRLGLYVPEIITPLELISEDI